MMPEANDGEDLLRSPNRRAAVEALLARLGLEPSAEALALVQQALVHRSYRSDHGLKSDNERLEFLGDSVIGLLATEHLLEHHPTHTEGQLSKMRAGMVSRLTLGRVAAKWELGPLLMLGVGEERTGGRERSSTLGSTLEAICGALYLAYPWDAIRKALHEGVIIPAAGLSDSAGSVDYKSLLQEWTQAEHQRVPEYVVISEEGPDHAKVFRVEVRLLDTVIGTGSGSRKKIAENEAAQDALARVPVVPQSR